MKVPKGFAATAALILGAACRTPSEALGDAQPLVDVVLRNPGRRSLSIVVVRPSGEGPSKDLGADSETRLRVVSGRYRIEVRDVSGEVLALAAPALAELLDGAPLVVEVPERDPPAEADWVWVPPGPAVVGDVLGVGQEDERPARLVDPAGFWIARTETTNAAYAAFLDAVGAADPAWIDLESRKCRVRRDPATGRFTTDAPNLPVVTVTLAGARAYAAWLTRTDGRIHRLPTEAEWEKAARGPSTRTFAYGDVFRRRAAAQECGGLEPVGSYGPCGFGACDLTGNAFEWTDDAYDATAYARARRDGAAPRPSAGSVDDDAPYHALRGGSFVLDGMYLRNSFRMRQRADVRADDIGFRPVREAPSEGSPR